MSIANDLNDVMAASANTMARLAVFAEHIPDEWINAAAALSAKATIRRRRLPADLVLWLVVGMAFFRNEPISEVARRLNICAEGLANEALLADSALSQARQRLGKQPLAWLFKQCADVWGRERYPEDLWHGLQVFAVDGALFRTQDTPELRAHFWLRQHINRPADALSDVAVSRLDECPLPCDCQCGYQSLSQGRNSPGQ
ncbi:hypothetical protein GCM10023095_03220 [Pseudaeromonas paramecii]|uniref:Transposase IS4 N-terminal domain-containing protein n=1 Tax=Pseudaeromonas paramecii TaxID=2138166 RepID=A0ABP8PXK3_9GAMM